MNKIKKLEIWMVKLDHANIIGHEQRGTRPFFVISNTRYNEVSKTPVGFFLSTSEHKKLNRFTLEVSGDKKGAVNVSQIRTLSSERFLYKIGEGTQDELNTLMAMFSKEILGE